MQIVDAANQLGQADKILILTHRRPDGDTLGSAAALCLGLQSLGKTAYLLINPEVTEKYTGIVQPLFAPEDFSPAYVVSVDIADLQMFPEPALPYRDGVDLCIDHHMSNKRYAKAECVIPEMASCGEIIYEILVGLGVSITREIGVALYTAVSTDTGCFKYSNTTPHTHRVAAAVMETGFDAGELNRVLFDTKTRARIEMEKRIMAQMRFYAGGRIAVCPIYLKDLSETGATENDMDNISAFPRKIEGVDAGVTIKENGDGCKISVRTSKRLNAAAICARLGGGGHVRAAGGFVSAPPEEAERAVLEAIYGEYPDVERDLNN